MADSSLDDFFAKKDKSKKSKKFMTTEQIAKKLEDGGKTSVDRQPTFKKEKEKVSNTANTVISQNYQQEDDEWLEVEEKETDYTGLKIQNLQLSERDEEQEKDKFEEQSEDGEHSKLKDGSSPWMKGITPPEPEPPVVEVKQEAAPQTGVYIPPNQRTGAQKQMARKLKNKKSPPEIASETDFPTLSMAAEVPKSGTLGSPDYELGFESVKRGSRNVEDTSISRGPKLDLGNKYEGLNEGENS